MSDNVELNCVPNDNTSVHITIYLSELWAMVKVQLLNSQRACILSLETQQDIGSLSSSIIKFLTVLLQKNLVELSATCHSKMEEVIPRNITVRYCNFRLGYLYNHRVLDVFFAFYKTLAFMLKWSLNNFCITSVTSLNLLKFHCCCELWPLMCLG